MSEGDNFQFSIFNSEVYFALRAGREVDYYHEKGNLENGDSTGDISSNRSSNHARSNKLHVIAHAKGVLKEK